MDEQSPAARETVSLTARFDVFLSHNSRDKPIVERIAEGLKRAGLEPWLDKWSLTPGGRWQEELAAGLNASAACAVCIGPADLGDWEREELGVAQDRAAKDRDFRLFLVLLPELPEKFDASLLLPFLSTRTWVDLRVGLDSTRAFQSLVNAVKGVPLGPEVPIEPVAGVSPYRGLEVFDEEHAEFFFGREGDVQRLVEKLKASRFLAVLGPSGSGKSSLVRAGLIPALRHGALTGSESWTVEVLRPGAHPLDTLSARLVGLYPDLAGYKTRDELRADPGTLRLLLSRPPTEGPKTTRIVWVVDQFEEVFTLCRDEEERGPFLLNLLQAAAADGPSAVVLTLRADFYARCAAYPELAQQAATHQYLVGAMGRDGLRQAIEEPARRVGLEFEAGLVATILDDVESEPGALPLLQQALLELWERRRGRMLTLEAYRESGGVQGAIAKRADAIYAAFTPEQQGIARQMFLRLTQPGEGTEDTRRRAAIGELDVGDDEDGAFDRVLRVLVDARMLTTSGGEQEGQRWVDVSHEALIRGWPRLRCWIDEDRAGLIVHRRITEAAEEWRLDRDDDALYRGARLAEALEWRERSEASLNDLERAFLAASDELRSRESRAARRRMLVGVAGLVVALVVISAVAAFALLQRNTARHQARISRAGELATKSIGQLAIDPMAALRLAAQATHKSPTAEAGDALRQAFLKAPIFVVRAGVRSDENGDGSGAGFSPDGTFLVTTGNNRPQVWDLKTGELVASLVGHPGYVAVTFSPDGSLVVTRDEHAFHVWKTATGDAVAALPKHGVAEGYNASETDVNFSPRGRLLVTSDERGATVWNTRTWKPISDFPHERFATFSPDGSQLVFNAWKVFVVRDATSRQRLATLRAPVASHFVSEAAYSRDSGLIALTSADRGAVVGGDIRASSNFTTVTIRSATDWEIVRSLKHLSGDWSRAIPSFSPDDRFFALTGPQTIAWSTRSWKQVLRRDVYDLSPDWTLGVTRHVGDDTERDLVAMASGERVAELKSDSPAMSVAFGPTGLIATAGGDPTVRVWRPAIPLFWSKQFLLPGRGNEQDIRGVAFVPTRKLVAVGSNGFFSPNRIELSRPNGERTHLAVATGPETLSFSPDGRFLLASEQGGVSCQQTSCKNSPIEVFMSATWAHAAQLDAGSGFAWSKSAQLLAVWPQGWSQQDYQRMTGRVSVFDSRTWQLKRTKGGRRDRLVGADFNANGTEIVSVRRGSAIVWKVADGHIVRTIREDGGSITAAEFAPVDDAVVTTDADGAVQVWRPGRSSLALRRPERVFPMGWFSTDGTLLALTSEDGASTSVWETRNWKLLAAVRGIFTDFSRDDQFVVTQTTNDDVGHVWETRTGARVAEISATGGLRSEAFASDGTSLVAVGNDGVVRTIPCFSCAPIDQLLAEADRRIAAGTQR